MEPTFFASPADLRAWLQRHHEEARELLVGFHKKATNRPSLTWPESVDQALCFGWIDGVRRSHGPDAYTIRFTPRTPRSTWSAVNVARMRELIAAGLVHSAGLRAFERSADDRTATYRYEQRRAARLPDDYARRLAEHPAAATFFAAQPPSYRRMAAHWVTSAKRPETRERRLARLIEDSAAGRRIEA